MNKSERRQKQLITKRVMAMNVARKEQGITGGRHKLPNTVGTPEQVKLRLAKRESRKRLSKERI